MFINNNIVFISKPFGITKLNSLFSEIKTSISVSLTSVAHPMSLIILITAVLGFNSLTGTEVIHTAISNTAPKDASDLIETVVPSTSAAKPVVTQVSTKTSIQDSINELRFESAQLESQAVMLETLQLIEGNN